MKKIPELLAALSGALLSFLCGLPPVLWVLLAAMSLDLLTGLLGGLLGRSPNTQKGGLSSKAALRGLGKKAVILLVVLLAALVDRAVALSAGVSFEAVSGAVCLWFIASEGLSILENAAALGIPVPAMLKNALELMRSSDPRRPDD